MFQGLNVGFLANFDYGVTSGIVGKLFQIDAKGRKCRAFRIRSSYGWLASNEEAEPDEIEEQAPVIVAGVGRFGQIVCRLLRANNMPSVALDQSLEQIENLRRIQLKSYFGDATRIQLLETAGIAEARLLVVAIDDRNRAVNLVRHVKQLYPEVWVLARAFDRGHSYELREAGANGQSLITKTKRPA